MSVGKAVLAAVGGFLAIVGLALIAGGGGLLWAYSTQRAADGFFESPVAEMSTESYAITSTEMDLGSLPALTFGSGWLATVQVSADSRLDSPLFIGIGPTEDVNGYLAGVAHAEVSDIDSRTDIAYQTTDGEAPRTLPSEEGFWVTSTEGEGEQSFTWDLERGDWTIVIMNADASPVVSLDVTAGVRTNWVPVLLVVLLVAGVFSLTAGSIMNYYAYKRAAPAVAEAAAPKPSHVLTGTDSDSPR